jgi:ABC-type antimicrobial peptide transport system permease subunit
MFDPNVTSITCGSLDFFESAVDFDDLAFLNLIMCMQESDNALAAKMKEIRAINDLKRQITEEINYLNEALNRSHAKGDGKHGDDYVYVEGGLESPRDPSEGQFATKEEQQNYEKEWESKKGNMEWHTERTYNDDGSYYESSGEVEVDNKFLNEEKNLYQRKDVEAKVEELRSQLEELNTSSSVLMIDLQRLMNKRNEATQLVSNIEAKSHQTAQAILANIK